MRIRLILAASFVSPLLATACAGDATTEHVGVTQQAYTGEQHDLSGRVSAYVHQCRCPESGDTPGSIACSCGVQPGYLLIGGGAYAKYTGAGAMLTYSRPCGDSWQTWCAGSKDHVIPDAHHLTVYAIGIALRDNSGNWIPWNELADHNRQVWYADTLYAGHHPTGPCTNWAYPGYEVIGGGAEPWTTPGGAGQLLTDSYPASANSWYAGSKDHYYSDVEKLRTWCIGFKKQVDNFGVLTTTRFNAPPHYWSGGDDWAADMMNPGYAPLAYGGKVTYNKAGRMLFGIGPTSDDPSRWGITLSKDHYYPDDGYLTFYMVGAKCAGTGGACTGE